MSSENDKAYDIVIVVLTYNNEKTIAQCLQAISSQNYPKGSYKALVIDNGSTDSTLEIVKAFNIDYHVFPKMTIGQLRNEGAKRAKAPVVGFIDSDCEVSSDWIISVLKHFKDDRVGIAGCMYDLPPQPSFVERHWIGKPCVNMAENRLIPAGNMAVSKRIFNEIGGFDEKLISGEDVYLLNQARLHGYKTIYDPTIKNIHFGNPKTIADLYRKEIWYGIRGDSIINRIKAFDKAFIASNVVLLIAASLIIGLMRFNIRIILSACLSFLMLSLASAMDRKYVKKVDGNLFYMTFFYSIYLLGRMHSLVHVYGNKKHVYVKNGYCSGK